jgi:hypothetical protein
LIELATHRDLTLAIDVKQVRAHARTSSTGKHPTIRLLFGLVVDRKINRSRNRQGDQSQDRSQSMTTTTMDRSDIIWRQACAGLGAAKACELARRPEANYQVELRKPAGFSQTRAGFFCALQLKVAATQGVWNRCKARGDYLNRVVRSGSGHPLRREYPMTLSRGW